MLVFVVGHDAPSAPCQTYQDYYADALPDGTESTRYIVLSPIRIKRPNPIGAELSSRNRNGVNEFSMLIPSRTNRDQRTPLDAYPLAIQPSRTGITPQPSSHFQDNGKPLLILEKLYSES
ncbi:hypothetical protein QZM08_02150 [Burkholderia vietnamiensis]|nr:hypothetical protein [Burkholderia vietnamiensis]MDN7665086.1 hypothetical protein [Burkholderia vietnamiensis]